MNLQCPSSRELRALIEDQLTEAELCHVDEHVAGCLRCQDQLDTMTDDGLTNTLAFYAVQSDNLLRAIQNLKSGQGSSSIEELPHTAYAPHFPDAPTREGPLGAIGRYKVVRQIGSGSAGLLFEAWDVELQRKVALKLLKGAAETSEAQATRLLREARALVQLDHENIVKVYDAVERSDVAPFLVMELVEGGSLADTLRRRNRIKPTEAAKLTLQAANGLEAAHQKGLIHRDVKPSNLLLRKTDKATQLCVADFGLVRLQDADSTLTKTGELAGTPAYMSPEQVVCREELDARTDVYSLGCVLYELLTGAQPFDGTVRMVLWQAVHEDPKPPSKFDDAIPKDLETICLTAMAKNRDRRYESCQHMASDIQRFLHNEKIVAKRPGTLNRLWRIARQRPVQSTIASASVVVFLVVTLVSSIAAYRLSAAQSKIEAAAQRAEQGREVALDAMEAIVFDAYDALDKADTDPDALQIQLLESAARGLSKIDDSDNPDTLLKRAETHQRLARAMWRLDHLKRALAQVNNAESLLARAVQLTARSDAIQVLELQIVAIKSTIQFELESPEFTTTLEAGLALFEQITGGEQSTASEQTTGSEQGRKVWEAGTSLYQDQAYWLSSNQRDPSPAFSKAIELHKQLGPIERLDYQNQALRLQLMEERADEHYSASDHAQALKAFDMLLNVSQRLQTADQSGNLTASLSADYRYYLASAYSGRGSCFAETGRRKLALQSFENGFSQFDDFRDDLISIGDSLIVAEAICSHALELYQTPEEDRQAIVWAKRSVTVADASYRAFVGVYPEADLLSERILARQVLASFQEALNDSAGKQTTDMEIRRLVTERKLL